MNNEYWVIKCVKIIINNWIIPAESINNEKL